MTYADTCTKVYSPNGEKAHLAAPGAREPMCPARGRPPKGGWRGHGSPGERAWADSLGLCQHCVKLAAAKDDETPQQPPGDTSPDAAVDAAEPARNLLIRGSGGPAADETPAGSAHPVEDADPAGTIPAPEPLEPLPPDTRPQGLSGQTFRDRFRAALSLRAAGQRGDRGRRTRLGRNQGYGAGQNRRGGDTP